MLTLTWAAISSCIYTCIYLYYIFLFVDLNKLYIYNCDLLNTTGCNILCLQEIWTLDSTIDMLTTIHKDYMYTGISGIDNTKEILHGRPKCGVAILFKKSLTKYVSHVKIKDRRICAIKLCMEIKFSCIQMCICHMITLAMYTVVSDSFGLEEFY